MPTSTLRCRCGCKNRGRREDMIVTPSGAAFMDESHAASYAKSRGAKLRQRQEADEAKQERKRLRAVKADLMSIEGWVAKTQAVVNRVVRFLDRALGCISCASPVDDAGHYFHRGSKYRISPLTLLMLNLNGQCRHCNSFAGGGNQHEYRIGFIRRYGQQAFDYLCEYKDRVDRGEIPPLTIEDCKEILAVMRPELKRLERGEPPSRDWRSIQSQEARLAGRGEQEKDAA